MYYNVPASQLIFLTHSEHTTLHNKNQTEERRKKNSEWHIGKCPSEGTRRKLSTASTGKHHTEKTKRTLSNINKGKHLSEETRMKMSERMKAKRWFNNGKVNVRAKECPEGFVAGIIKK